MKYFAGALILSLLAACVAGQDYEAMYRAGKPLEMSYKSNASLAQIDNETLDCEIESQQRVPAAQRINNVPGYVMPTYTTCSGYGAYRSCTTSGGNVVGGGSYVYDANGELRGRAYNQCMSRKGIRMVNVLPCPTDMSKISGLPNKLPTSPGRICYLVENGVLQAALLK